MSTQSKHKSQLLKRSALAPAIATALSANVQAQQEADTENDNLLEEVIVTTSKREASVQDLFMSVTAALALTLFLFGASSAAAQQADSDLVLEEVIVTAQKREQNLQDVGLSVTALDFKALAEAGIRDASRLSLVVPGMNYGFYGSDAKIAIRGAHTNNTYGDNQSVAGLYIDGVYRARPSQQSQPWFDVERVEVLKGPQGTLYGRNTFAGAVNVWSRKPNTEATSTWVEVGFGRFRAVTTEGFFNIPVSDDFALRAAFRTDNSDGYIENSGLGADFGGDNGRNFRLSALWTPGDNVELVLRYTSISLRDSQAGIFSAEGICRPLNASGATDAFGTISSCSQDINGVFTEEDLFGTPYTVSQSGTPERDYTEDNVTLDISWDMSHSWGARIITSYTDFDNEQRMDADGTNDPGYDGQYFDEEIESTTFEFNTTYIGDGPLTATLGLYWSEDQYGYGYSEDPFGETYSYCGGDACIYADWQDIKITTKAAFAQLEYAVSDSVRLIGGIRYNDEKKDTKSYWTFTQFDSSGNPLPGVKPDAPFTILPGYRPRGVLNYDLRPTTELGQKFDDVTWRAGIDWAVNDDVMLYVNAATGYLSGGVNGDGTKFDQQNNLAYEAGLKSRWADNTVQFNIAIYRNEGTDLTTQEAEIIDNVFITKTVNGGEVVTKGLEAELAWLPTDQWRISAALSLMDSEHTDFGINNGWQEANGLPIPFLSLNGTTPPWAPDVTLFLSARYDIDLGDKGMLTPFLQVYYSDEFNTDDLVTYSTQVQDSYTKVDFRLFWTSVEGTFTAEAYIENIGDEAVLARTNVSGTWNRAESSYLFPRNYGLRVSWRYN
jgi:outer membrane receptor protein involved in Fe transport